MGQNGLIFLGLAIVVVVIANALAVQRRKARKEQSETFASLHGFRSEGDVNPFLNVNGSSPPMLTELAADRGTVRNVLRGSTVAGEVILFDYRPSAAASSSDSGGVFSTVAAFRVPGGPEFQLMRRARFTFAIKLIEFPAHARFSKRFMLMSNDETAARRAFTPSVIEAVEALADKRDWSLQAGSGWLFVTFGPVQPQELTRFVEQSARVASSL